VKADIKAVMNSLSEVSASELQAAGYSVDQLADLMQQWARGGEPVVVLDRATPIAILIFQRTATANVLGTAFMATEGFFGGRSQPTRFLRKYLDQKMRKMPGVALVSLTYSQHPTVERWYRLMGYGDAKVEGAGRTFTRGPHRENPAAKRA
jgi:hypothetical protein